MADNTSNPGPERAAGAPKSELTPEQLLARRLRVRQKTENAIEYLAACDLAAAASILRVGEIQVIDDPEQCKRFPTAALVKEGHFTSRMRIVMNAEFCDRPQSAVTAILLHELLHHIMKHLEGVEVGSDKDVQGVKVRVQDQQLANITFDAFINYTISVLNPSLAGFMRDFYPADKAPWLFLRSRSKPKDRMDAKVYRSLYDGKITEQDLYDYLERQGHGGDGEYVLIGGHGLDGENPIDAADVPGILAELNRQLRNGSQKGGELAGKFDQLMQEFIRLKKIGRVQGMEDVFRMNLIEACKAQVVQSMVGDIKDQPLRRVIMPAEGPSRGDMFKIMAGMEVMLWDNFDINRKHGAANVYIDVSGSMVGEVEFVYSCCAAFEEYLNTDIYLFSNQIDAISLDELKRGKISSTYGTDFDCVVEHFLETEADRCILFTDGHASLRDDLSGKLREAQRKVVGVVTHGGSDRVLNEFCETVHRMPAQAQYPLTSRALCSEGCDEPSAPGGSPTLRSGPLRRLAQAGRWDTTPCRGRRPHP